MRRIVKLSLMHARFTHVQRHVHIPFLPPPSLSLFRSLAFSPSRSLTLSLSRSLALSRSHDLCLSRVKRKYAYICIYIYIHIYIRFLCVCVIHIYRYMRSQNTYNSRVVVCATFLSRVYVCCVDV